MKRLVKINKTLTYHNYDRGSQYYLRNVVTYPIINEFPINGKLVSIPSEYMCYGNERIKQGLLTFFSFRKSVRDLIVEKSYKLDNCYVLVYPLKKYGEYDRLDETRMKWVPVLSKEVMYFF